MASLFEAPLFPSPGEIHGAPNWRMPRLVDALASRDAHARPRLDALFSMSDPAFASGDRSLHYATARALCEWLDERGELWPFYRAWRDHVERDPDGTFALRAAIGKTPAQANDDWVRWVQMRSRPHAP